MPPLVPRKRLQESPPLPNSESGKRLKKEAVPRRRQPTLYDDLDDRATARSTQDIDALLQIGSDDDSNLTSLSSEEFEDVSFTQRPAAKESDEKDDEDEEDMEFENVAAPDVSQSSVPALSGDLDLTLNQDGRISLVNAYGDKKGPSKRERKIRNASHCLHVMCLLWHNAVRNAWLCDPELQAILISHLPSRVWDEYDRWRQNSGLNETKGRKAKPNTEKKAKGRRHVSKGEENEPHHRDWGTAASGLESGKVDMSSGDPLFRFVQYLTYWWRKRFRTTAPGLRKRGYMALERLDKLMKGHKEDPHDPDRFGEKLTRLEDLRRCARNCAGSRDVGAQLFTAILRGLGLEARLVASLQCLGFSWNKYEDAEPEQNEPTVSKSKQEESPAAKSKTPSQKLQKKPAKTASKTNNRPNRNANGNGTATDLHNESLELDRSDTDDESVVELHVVEKHRPAGARSFDQDLDYPHYWSEILSPITHRYLPVDVIVKNVIATNKELTESFEPRGAKAERARQVTAYIVGYARDGTAKDVTVRYLKKQFFPGRTKGARLPIEKRAVYNHMGKVKKYEQFDWFKTAMSGYRRGTKQHPVTEVDQLEDATDLKPAQQEKKEVKEGEETLQYFKQSKDFVLERHLKREEALKPGAARVKIFKNKLKGGKIEEEDVFARSDVLNVKSAETWHKQGRAPIPGEEPLKRVPYRAATTNRRRELLEAEAATGQKVLQGLYGYDQTDWIIPPPIKDGVIPKNEYGNIDLFAEHMCPQGAVHIPYKGVMKVCKRLAFDYAEAVVGFEFGHRMAVPVIQGVVIAEENYEQVLEEWQKDEAERQRKEDEKRRKLALGQWRKFLMGMRIVERIRVDYGDIDENVSVFAHSKGDKMAGAAANTATEEEMAGGFLPEGFEGVENEDDDRPQYQTSGFFAAVNEEDDDGDENSLVVEHLEGQPSITRLEQGRREQEEQEEQEEQDGEYGEDGKGEDDENNSGMPSSARRKTDDRSGTAISVRQTRKPAEKLARRNISGIRRSARHHKEIDYVDKASGAED